MEIFQDFHVFSPDLLQSRAMEKHELELRGETPPHERSTRVTTKEKPWIELVRRTWSFRKENFKNHAAPADRSWRPEMDKCKRWEALVASLLIAGKKNGLGSPESKPTPNFRTS